MEIKRARAVNLLNYINEILTGAGTIVLGYNDQWQYACGVMVLGYIIKKVGEFIKKDGEIIEKKGKNE